MKLKLLFVTALLTASLCFGQSERGNIVGLVTDASNAVVPGAPVKVINTATNATQDLTTSSGGEFNAANLPPGVYRVEVVTPGFQSYIVDGLTLTAGSTARANIRLEVGGVTQTIEVQAQSVLVQTEDAKISTNISNTLIDQLPLVVGGAMRSPFDLASTTADAKGGSGMILGGGQSGSSSATFDGIRVNTNRGANTGETNYLTPSVEAITEFTIDTNGFKAEFGQAGGGVISFASKSGTNEWHGSAYDFLRNDKLDARGFFATEKGIYKQNDFGATLGGPVRIPKLYNGKNRTFFFFSYEGFRIREAETATFSSVPTAEMWNGDFSNLVNSSNKQITIYDPTTTRPNPSGSGFIRDPFPGNKIPTSQFSAVSNQYVALAKAANLVPNRPGIVPGTYGYVNNNYVRVGGGSTAQATDKLSLKLDHALNNNHRLSYVYNHSDDLTQPGSAGPVGLPVPFNGASRTTYDADLHRATYDWNVSSHAFNHLTWGMNTFKKDSYSINVGGEWKNTVCILNAVDCNNNMGRVSFSEFAGWGGASNNGTEQPSWVLQDNLSYIRGSHSFKFGYTYDHQEANGFGQQSIAGTAGFSFLETAVPGATSATSGSSFASFLMGWADTGNTETPRYLRQIYRYHAMFAQDDWRVTRKLMLNYGVRYEFTMPPVSEGDQYSDFSPTEPNPTVNNHPGALVFAGFGDGRQNTRSLIPGYYGAISPRLGLAYTLNEKTTIRAGIGESFGRVSVLGSSSHYAGFIGQYNFASPDQGINPAFKWDVGMPAYPLPPQIDPAFQNNQDLDYWNGQDSAKPATYYNWTLSVQRQVTERFTAEADYNATMGSRLNASLMNINQVPMTVFNALVEKFGATQAISLMNSKITSPAAVAAGFTAPYAAFTTSAQRSQTVSQSLRPFPQYLEVNTRSGGGDRSGHSTYHAGLLKLNYRASGLLNFQGSYSFSKIITNADSFSGSARAMDAGNPNLEKSVGSYDQTHTLRLNTVFEVPFGSGKRWLNRGGILNQVLGGWRISAVQSYNSGVPIGVTANSSLPIYNGANRPVVTSYDWLTDAATSGSFDPATDRYLDASAFPTQPKGVLGNAPRRNSRVRAPGSLSENISLAKTFKVSERIKIDFRAEAFNVFNRVNFAAPQTNLNSNAFGQISSQANDPRRMQGGLKLYW